MSFVYFSFNTNAIKTALTLIKFMCIFSFNSVQETMVRMHLVCPFWFSFSLQQRSVSDMYVGCAIGETLSHASSNWLVHI